MGKQTKHVDRELRVTDDFMAVVDARTGETVASLDSEAAPDIDEKESLYYAKLFAASPELKTFLEVALPLIEARADAVFEAAKSSHPGTHEYDALHVARVAGRSAAQIIETGEKTYGPLSARKATLPAGPGR